MADERPAAPAPRRDRRMDAFSKECTRWGTLSHFRHFTLHLRGREELLVAIPRGTPLATSARWARRGADGSAPLTTDGPGDELSDLSAEWGRALALGEEGADKAPASPCCRDQHVAAEHEAVFLIGAYAHYRCPYVYVRSGHALLPHFARDASAELDAPLKLRSTSGWTHLPPDGANARALDVHLWDVLAELVALDARPPPANPFALDLEALGALPARERLQRSAGLAQFLRELYLRSSFHSAVEADYLAVVRAYHLAAAKVQRGDAAMRSPAHMLAAALSEEAMQALDAVRRMAAATEGREGDGDTEAAHAPWRNARAATLRWSHSSQASQASQTSQP